MAGVKVSGVNFTIAGINRQYKGKRKRIKRALRLVTIDLLKESRARAPVLTGELIDGMSQSVDDLGIGRGFRGTVNNSPVAYANRMHEARYTAHPRSDYKRRISKKTGKPYFQLIGNQRGKRTVGVKTRTGGITVTQDRQRFFRAGGAQFWRDSAGNLHGRKYMTRAMQKNRAKYTKFLRAAGD